MSAFIKIKNPVEYRFQQWVRNFPGSGHSTDRKNFLLFVKNVCRYSATRWKDVKYLEEQILHVKPHFDRQRLQELLIIFEYLIDFYKTSPDTNTWFIDNYFECPKGSYIEIGYKAGKFYEVEKSYRKVSKTSG
jgi:hypothetical protein